MSLSSFRALLLTLAMVLQTVVAGAATAAPRSEGFGQASIEHCAQHATPADDASPAKKNRVDHQHCDKCLACCGAQVVAIEPQTSAAVTPLSVSRVARGEAVNPSPPQAISRISGARGPPRTRA